ncbi:MAG TPA: fumarylacetoacetate hydrolase family protein [Actinocrinis sp.]|nr:fumarylacetoacetate hydrolase family protein [Actinocrinis sp.]
MRLANVAGRLVTQENGRLVDVATASAGRFGPDPQSVYARWAEFTDWARQRPAPGPILHTPVACGPPVPRPPQSIGIGVNYADHAGEAGFDLPERPVVFPKFSSCIAGDSDVLTLPSAAIDWEVELVVVIGRTAVDVPEADAWHYVAGLTIGQDISDRALQFADAPPAQFGMGKSLRGFGPIGPWLVTTDELSDPDDLEISCLLNGEVVQHSRTKHLIFDVSALVSYLSNHLRLEPGDVLFTGTPAGVGFSRTPAVYLKPGDQLVSRIEGLGELVTRIGGTAKTGNEA